MQQTTIISTTLFFVIVFSFGYWLARTGKPYKGLTMNVHTLVSLAALGFLIVDIIQANKVSSLGILEWIVCGFTALFFIGSIVTGVLVNLKRPMPAFVLVMHKILPWLTLVSTGCAFYLIFA